MFTNTLTFPRLFWILLFLLTFIACIPFLHADQAANDDGKTVYVGLDAEGHWVGIADVGAKQKLAELFESKEITSCQEWVYKREVPEKEIRGKHSIQHNAPIADRLRPTPDMARFTQATGAASSAKSSTTPKKPAAFIELAASKK
jgi:hypothetical protein